MYQTRQEDDIYQHLINKTIYVLTPTFINIKLIRRHLLTSRWYNDMYNQNDDIY